MSGVGILIPGYGPGTGPIIPSPLHPVGVDGYSRRYVAERLTDGNFPDTGWPNLGTFGSELSILNSSVGSVSKTTDGPQYVTIDNGTSGAMMIGDANVISATTRTFAMVYRLSARLGTDFLMFLPGVRVVCTGSGGTTIRLEAIGTGAAGQINISSHSTGTWHLLIGVVDATSPVLQLNGTTSATVTNGPWSLGSASSNTRLQVTGNASSDQKLDVAELIVWDHALGSTEREVVRSALKAHYPILP